MNQRNMSWNAFPQVRQFLLFGLVGGSSTAVHYLLALALSQVMTLPWANPVGFISAFLVSYFGHSYLTFRLEQAQQKHRKRLPRFALVALGGFCMTQVIVVTLSSQTTFPNWLILAIALAVVPVLTFVAAKFWVFEKRESTESASSQYSTETIHTVIGYGSAAFLAVCFFLLTYPYPLEFLYGNSAYFEIGDLPQHVTGWLLFAKDAWRWPLLKTQLINPPEGAHIALMDSIPLAALLSKPFEPLLPENFHYFGLWHLLNKVLIACGAVFLLRSLRQNDVLVGLAGACLALLLPATLTRLMHTALGSQGLLLVALGLYFRLVEEKDFRRPYNIAFMVLNGALLLIHPYLLAMAFPVLLVAVADRTLRYQDWKGALELIVSSLLFVALLAVLLGYGGSPSDTNDTFRIFSMNLTSPVCGGSLSFCSAIDATNGQYEGVNYLGAGVLLILIVALLHWNSKALLGFVAYHPALLLMLLGLTVYSVSNHIYLGSEEIFTYSLFQPLTALAQTFRAPGRFFWLVGFVILFVPLAYGYRSRKTPQMLLILLAAVGLQWVDTKAFREQNTALLTAPRPFDYSVWKSFQPHFGAIHINPPYGCNGQIENMKYLYFQTVAAQRGVPLNTAYLARSNSECSPGNETTIAPTTLRVFFSSPENDAYGQEIAQGLAEGSCANWSRWNTILCLDGARAEDWRNLQLP